MKMRALLTLCAAVPVVQAMAVDTLPVPVRGEWCSDFAAAKLASESEGVPLVVFCARVDCGNCASLERAVESEDFVEWRKDRRLYMYFHEHTYDEWAESYKSGSVAFALKPTKLKYLPLMKVYWRPLGGEMVDCNFSGTMSQMSYPGEKTLQANLMKTVDKQLVEYYGYDPTVPRLDESYRLAQGVSVSLALEQVSGYSAKGLPAGVRFDKNTGALSGVAKKGGMFKVTFSRKGEDSVSTVFNVQAMPGDVVGTFNGFVGEKGRRRGTVTVSVSAAGAVTARAVLPEGTKTFKAAGFDDVLEDGSYAVEMAAKNGGTLDLAIASGGDWASFRLTGEYEDSDEEVHAVEAQRNVLGGKASVAEAKEVVAEFADKYSFDAIAQGDGAWKLVEPENPRKPGVTVQLAKNGQVKVNGTLGALKAVATGFAMPLRDDLEEERLTVEAAKSVRVGEGKRSLSILAVLSSDGSATGSARTVD